jgi:hypothetical protein
MLSDETTLRTRHPADYAGEIGYIPNAIIAPDGRVWGVLYRAWPSWAGGMYGVHFEPFCCCLGTPDGIKIAGVDEPQPYYLTN